MEEHGPYALHGKDSFRAKKGVSDSRYAIILTTQCKASCKPRYSVDNGSIFREEEVLGQ